ncbi:cubilin [Cylas formicarius]|uniref:cubilin n=1 Tax=Cylas formicarius TaxID=197179 RepID=UPI0029588243|nr:cubilin [Cylas formicarius]
MPADKNVKFIASAMSVNEMDLMATLLGAHNATKILKSYQSFISNYYTRIDDLEQRLMNVAIPVNGSNFTATARGPSQDVRLRRINQKLARLQTSLLTLQQLLSTDDCALNPCKNGGACRDLFNGFLCGCLDGWEGPTCEKDVNECARFAGTDLGCQNGATCVNRPGTYECLCPDPWIGLHCTRKSSDCSSGSTDICGHGTCIPQNNAAGYKCLCDQGWINDGLHAACSADVDECKLDHPPCSTNPLVGCVNVPGSFYCHQCPQGYTGNGYYCADINECELFNGGCSVSPFVECVNTIGSSKCSSCPPGYMGDGKTCSYKGVCHVNNGGCNIVARCVDNPSISDTYVQCICPAGYTGNGIGVAGCVPVTNSSSCHPNPCVYGTCVVNNQSYKCICQAPYSGTNCDILGKPCDSNPCQNGGTCQNVGLSFRCACLTGFYGNVCQEQRESCGGNLYGANGTLKYPPDDFSAFGKSTAFSCAWIIQTDINSVLNIKFEKFNLADEPCTYEWIQIHDGRNTVANPLGRFCGTALPLNGTFKTTHNMVYIWFKSDRRTTTKPQFEVSWKSENPMCSESLQASHGTIKSPGSPGNYPNNRDCFWLLHPQVGKRYLFHFYLLDIGNNPDCSRDFLEFFSGIILRDSWNQSKPFAKFCNTSLPSPFYSQSSLVLIHFHSDNNTNYRGFQLTYSTVDGVPGCGGVFTFDNGIIKSAELTDAAPETIECDYTIQTMRKTRIKLTFLELDVPDDSNCRDNYVAIYEGISRSAPLIGKYCGTTLPGSYTSVSSDVLVVSKTWKSRNHGWKIHYEIICGEQFTGAVGGFTSSLGTSTRTCIYEIIQPMGNLIILNLELNLLGSSNSSCGVSSHLEVRDGDSANSTLIGRYCGRTKIKVESSTNHLWLKFYKTSFFENFIANYTSIDVGCGGILRKELGTISSPVTQAHTGAYPAHANCQWVIIAPPGKVIQLTWMMFSLEQSFDCTYDYVQIFDNATEGLGGLMGKYCGHTLPPVMLSTSNIMTITFISDTTISSEGFLASYTFIKETNVCGGNYFTAGGVIKSPGYPNQYPINRECTWTITVPSGRQIMLNIDDFNIESYANCKYDWLEIRNGGTSASPLIGRYCGTTIPKAIPSHANKLFVKFSSDMSQTGHGFKMTWSSASTGCGGTLSSPSGSIISPHYPELYAKNTDCIWKITISAGAKIQAMFVDIDLEKHSVCGLDFVELFDGPLRNSKSLGKYCTTTTNPITSSGNSMLVRFKSDISFQGRGFNLQYSTLCHNTLTGFRGVIESPNFPNDYPQDQNCEWHIVVPQKNRINITFSHFQLERSITLGSNNCSFDYVEIEYLESQPSPDDGEQVYTKYGRYCGDNNPGLITINSDQAKIHFVSDSLLLGSGFRIEWQLFGCGGILTDPVGEIKSPNYPRGYPPNIECKWIIKVAPGNSIEITFIEIDVEKDDVCDYDFIKIYNGEDENYNLISQFCHQLKPITLTTTGNTAFVHFIADYSYQGKGFIANYSSVPTSCGGTLTAPSGSIFSPNYPKNYRKNDTCGWLIDIDENHVIELEFEDVDLVKNRLVTCQTNYIKVFDGPTQGYPVLQTICGNEKPNGTIISSYNQMYIEFRAHSALTSKGFMAKYKKGCGARITTQGSGTIQLHKEFDVGAAGNCSWTIESLDRSKHITLTITHMGSNYNWCPEDEHQVSIYNGPFSDSPLLGGYCGTKVPPPLVTDGSTMHIVIKENVDFFATYSVMDSQCGGTLTSMDGYFATPGYPNKYPFDMQCEWTIAAAPGNQLIINFIEFDILQSENCNTDYLEIRQGNSSGNLQGVYCGNQGPTNLTHVGSLWMLFKGSPRNTSNQEVTAKGFYGQYSRSIENQIFGKRGVIASPFYPQQFTGFATYTWTITVQTRMKIQIIFKEFFMEEGEEGVCHSTSLKVYDGPDTSSLLLGHFCGNSIPDPVTSSSNVVTIGMEVFSSRMGSIFLFEWEEIGSSPRLVSTNSSDCQESIFINEIHNYTLKSPGYPNGYGSNLNCEWIFSTIPMNHLKITFKVIDLFTFANRLCNRADVIEVYQRKHSNRGWELVRQICENEDEETIIHGTHLMKVAFKTNQFLNRSGFLAEVQEDCGGSLTDPTGYINFNEKSPQTRECQWNITVRSGRTIELGFVEFNLGPNVTGGCHNYLMIRNGQYSDSPILGNGKYCGNDIPSPNVLKSTGNHIYVKYTGSGLIQGFKLKYQEIGVECGGQIILSAFDNFTEISSPNYPNIPTPHTECIWIIRAPAGEILRIDFEERFDLTNDPNCNQEYVEIRDGGTEYSPAIGRYCGDSPSSNFSSDNIMYVKFFTNVDDPKNGFKAKVSIGYCGGTLRGTTGVIQSPEYRSFERSVNCTWHIKGPIGHYLDISFTKFNLMGTAVCNKGSNQVRLVQVNPYYKNASELATYCGRKLPDNITTVTNEVIVQYQGTNYQQQSFSLTFTSSQEECGGTLSQETGTLTSPGYPIMNHKNRYCYWQIRVPKGRRISFYVEDFDLDQSGHFIFVGIFNGFDVGPKIAFTRDLATDKTFYSTDNTARIIFWSQYPSTHRGFKITYSSNEPTICTGDFNQTNGIITHPNYTKEYVCQWVHDNFNPNETLAMTVTVATNVTFKGTACLASNTALTITDQDNHLIYVICYTTSSPIVIRSPFLMTKLLAQTRPTYYLNFSINYKTHPCGGRIVGEEGSIASPNYPNKPEIPYECAWVLTIGSEQTVKIQIQSLDLGSDCDKHSLSIYNGPSAIHPRIGKYCRDDKPDQSILAQSNKVYIEYRYEPGQQSSGKGFNLTYTPDITGCGGIFHDKSRIIQTPKYPQDYSNNVECVWEVRSNPGNFIKLNFIERFHIEEVTDCVNDYVEVFDFRDDSWMSLGRKCGRTAPDEFRSTTNKMKIIFRSNDKISASGFKAKWDWHCGGSFEATDVARYIVSPDYPNVYKGQLNCVYNITSKNRNVLYVQFLDFDLERGFPDCRFDNVTLSGGTFPISFGRRKTNDVYCGNSLPPLVRMRQAVTITFKTDKYVFGNGRGFKFLYKEENCGGIITKPSVIEAADISTSVRFYQPFMHCQWNITAPSDQIAVLNIQKLSMSNSAIGGRCLSQSLQVFNGEEKSGNRLIQLCGVIKDNVVVPSDSGKMVVKLSTSAHSFRGFMGEVYFTYGPTKGCGGFINLTESKIIHSPNDLSDLDCQWKIMAPKDYKIQMNFTAIKIPGHCGRTAKNFTYFCTCAFIEINDGGGPFSELMAKLCSSDNRMPRSLTTSWNTGFIRMFVAGTFNDVFSVTLTPIRGLCGSSELHVTNQLQILTSPNYPNSYPEEIKCTWVLHAEMFKKIFLHFEEFDLVDEGERNKLTRCEQDKLEIIEDPNREFISEGFGTSAVHAQQSAQTLHYMSREYNRHGFCGRNDKPFDFYSADNTVTIAFKSLPSGHKGRGFKLLYGTSGCDRNLTEDNGRLVNSHNSNRNDCTISITVPENHTISLYFLLFYTSQRPDCKDLGIEIRETNSTGTELLRACGFKLPNPVFSNTNKLWIQFHNLPNFISRYDITYTSSPNGPGCGGTIYNYKGVFASPLYPNQYRKDFECVWIIRVPLEHELILRITEFDIQGGCDRNKLMITTYEYDNSESMNHIYCAQDKPAELRSKGQTKVTYYSTVSNGGTGWLARFQAVRPGETLL